jgi:hypothetical protein
MIQPFHRALAVDKAAMRSFSEAVDGLFRLKEQQGMRSGT